MSSQSSIARVFSLTVVLIVIGSAFYLLSRPGNDTPTIGEDNATVPKMLQYESASYGLRFSYPDTYVLTEQDVGNQAEREHHAIAIINKIAAANIPQGGEGPTAITIDIYGNGIDKQTPENWIRNSSPSNFKLSPDQKLSTTTVGGAPAYSYTWDGLYRGDSVVISHASNILMFTVTYMDATDPIRTDFQQLLQSLTLQ